MCSILQHAVHRSVISVFVNTRAIDSQVSPIIHEFNVALQVASHLSHPSHSAIEQYHIDSWMRLGDVQGCTYIPKAKLQLYNLYTAGNLDASHVQFNASIGPIEKQIHTKK